MKPLLTQPGSAQGLRAGALPFSSVLMQGVPQIAPAVGLALSLQFIVTRAANLGLFVCYPTKRRAEFNLLFHLIFPAFSTLSLAWVFYQSIVPLPPAPLRYAPILVGLWLLAGLALLCMGHGASLVPVAHLDLAQAAEAAPTGLNLHGS